MKFLAADTVGFSLGGADGVIGLGRHYEDEELSFIHMLKKIMLQILHYFLYYLKRKLEKEQLDN